MAIRLNIFQWTSHAILWLVFCFLFTGCRENKKEEQTVFIIYEYSKAVAVGIPGKQLKGLPEDSIRKYLSIHLKGNTTPILGEITIRESNVVFAPLVAFTPGLTYEVRLKNELIATETILRADEGKITHIVSVYPSADTLPENLLKFYIEFSRPMQEGYALENIVLIKNGKDTIPAAFLDLQPELWNKEGTILTLWLDPGRIKQDLQPNKKLGAPLDQGYSYSLLIKQDWRDAEGQPLSSGYSKNFITSSRDGISPNIDGWEISSPKAGSKESLKIKLHEPLDYLLLTNAVGVFYDNDKSVEGKMETGENEKLLVFTPAAPWIAGHYTLGVEARLEDLAGNNLNRLFDKDVAKKDTGKQKEFYSKYFIIK